MAFRFAGHGATARWWSRIVTQPERVFLLLAIPIGLAYLFITPPFNAPDEPNHFYRAWHISTGHPMAVKADNRVGGHLPLSLHELARYFDRFIGNQSLRVTPADLRDAAKISLNQDAQRFYDFNNTAAYPTLCYLPHAMGILVGRSIDLAPVYCFYLARLFAWIVWLFCLHYAIRIIPLMKWLFTAMALLPMSAYINMSVSADVVTTSVCMLFIAGVFRCAFSPVALSVRDIAMLVVFTALLASVKMPYVPLALLVVVIPASRFAIRYGKLKAILAVSLCAFVVTAFWYARINALYIVPSEYNPVHGPEACLPVLTDVHKQAEWLFSSYDVFRRTVTGSLQSCAQHHFASFIAAFGWKQVTMPWFVVVLAYLFLLAIALLDGNVPILGWSARTMMIFCVLCTFAAIVMSLYLSWHWVLAPYVERLPGRYLIPFYPLVLMIFHTGWRKQPAAAVLTMLLAVALNVYGIILLVNRYFLPAV